MQEARSAAGDSKGDGKGRGVKWPGISQVFRTPDRDVSREQDKKPLSSCSRGVGLRSLSPLTFLPRLYTELCESSIMNREDFAVL